MKNNVRCRDNMSNIIFVSYYTVDIGMLPIERKNK